MRVCIKKKDKKQVATVKQRDEILNFSLMNSKIVISLYFCAIRNNRIRQHRVPILFFLWHCTLGNRDRAFYLTLFSVFTFLHLVILHFCLYLFLVNVTSRLWHFNKIIFSCSIRKCYQDILVFKHISVEGIIKECLLISDYVKHLLSQLFARFISLTLLLQEQERILFKTH